MAALPLHSDSAKAFSFLSIWRPKMNDRQEEEQSSGVTEFILTYDA